MPDEGLRGPPPRRGVRRREARRLRRLRRHLRPDLPALNGVAAGAGGTESALLAASRRQLVVESLGIAVSGVAFGFVYGLSAHNAGFSPIEAMAMSVIVFAGAAQFAAIGYVAGGLAWPGVILLTALLNARHLLYSAALAPRLREVPAPRRALMAQVLTDEAFALSIGHFSRIGRTDERGYWIAAIGADWIPWNLATLAGVTIGGQIPDPAGLGLDVVFPASMMGLAVGLMLGRREVVAAGGGAAIAVVTSLAVGPAVGIIGGGLLGPLIGMAVPGRAAGRALHDGAAGLP
ncbi:MAG TPA: AzlC family ABC transporter permease [Candidatus Limnocylindrales bacterium]